MNTAAWALVISIVSATVAATSLGWNIYREVVLRARVKVGFAKKNIITTNYKSPDYVGISATNHGPGTVTLNSLVLVETSLWKRIRGKRQFAYLMYDYTNQHSGKFPRKLEVGESENWFMPFDDPECFLKEPMTHLGITDSFGRTHWAPKRQMTELRTKWLVKFAKGGQKV